MKILLWFVAIGVVLFATFFFLTRRLTGYKIVDGKVVYQKIRNTTWKKVQHEVEGADPETLKVFGFSGVYAKDKNRVFLEGNPIPEADPSSFKILEDLHKYAKDNTSLFCSTRKIGEISDGFEYLGGGFAKNDSHVFNLGAIIPRAHAKTFELMDEKGFFAKDHQSVFCSGKKLIGVHAATFKKVKYCYYVDQHFVYYLSNKLEHANSADFEYYGDRYSKSGDHVYYREKVIQGADAKTFKVLSSRKGKYFAEDKNYKYWGGKKVDQFPKLN
ncbi:MAG: DKNYY domain-containing protein [Saprospiraceae bacterium]|nr:DKNYY domain-containing protein [Saprospiraceae bacterium]